MPLLPQLINSSVVSLVMLKGACARDQSILMAPVCIRQNDGRIFDVTHEGFNAMGGNAILKLGENVCFL